MFPYESSLVSSPQRLPRPKLAPMDVITTVLLYIPLQCTENPVSPHLLLTSALWNTHSLLYRWGNWAQRLKRICPESHRWTDLNTGLLTRSFLRKISHSTDIHWMPTFAFIVIRAADRRKGRPRLCPSCLKLRVSGGHGAHMSHWKLRGNSISVEHSQSSCRKNCGHPKLWVNPSQWEWRGFLV